MKKILLFICLFCSHGFYSFSQEMRVKTIDPDFVNAKKALVFTKGDMIAIETDSIYLMNAKIYAYFLLLHMNYLDKSTDTLCDRIIKSYEKILKEKHEEYQKLLSNCEEADSVSLAMMHHTRQSLEVTQATLKYTQQSLDQTLQTLESANKYMKKERSKSIFEKVLLGVGGLGLGLAVGVLIAH